MNTNEFIYSITSLIEKSKEDHMSQAVNDTNKWISNHFRKYCLKNDIQEISMKVINEFHSKQYDIDVYNFKYPIQYVLRRPLL